MIILDYFSGIHPASGMEYNILEDIIITPFWTEEFCENLITISKSYANYFSNDIEFNSVSEKKLGWYDLRLDFVSPLFFREYTRHYKRDISPILKKVYSDCFGEINGWFPPYIIKYDSVGQKSDLHHDVSTMTLNVKLNSNYEGCDLYFPRQNFNCRDVPVGYAVIWPSTVTHPHGSTELKHGEKYSFVSWTWPPNWNNEGIKNE